MKRLFTIALCATAVLGLSAQKAAVDQAKKLSGKPAGLAEARSLIKDALQNPETSQQAETYFIAGKIELDAYDDALKSKMIGNTSAETSPEVMGKELLDAYKYFMQALPLDSMPNEKGQIKPKVSKDIVNKLAGHADDFFTVGADFFNAKKYYPEAYEAFMIYGDLPEAPFFGKSAPSIEPNQIATAYFNAGLSAYSGNEVDKSAEAFKKARLAGYDQPESYIYEIACWQNIAQNNENRSEEARLNISDIAKDGYAKFGLEQPVFINNLINNYVMTADFNGALAELDPIIEANPENAGLYGLRGFVNDRAGNDDASEADYRKAASLPDVDFETLKNVSKKLFRLGTNKLNEIEGNTPEANQARENIKVNYFEAAKDAAEKAGSMNPNDDDLANVMESIDYALTTYFSN